MAVNFLQFIPDCLFHDFSDVRLNGDRSGIRDFWEGVLVFVYENETTFRQVIRNIVLVEKIQDLIRDFNVN